MSTHNNNYEPTSRVNYEHTTPHPYLNSSYLPPPPPEYYMHQRTGKAWKIAIPVVLLLLGVAVGILFYPDLSGMINPSSLASKPTPYVPFSMPAVTPMANTSYTARDIMQDILNTGDKPASITYDQEINGMDGTPLSVNATSSVDFTEGCSGGNCEPDSLTIVVYKSYADAKQANNYQLNAVYTFTPPANQPSIGPGYPYLHGRCLLIGADGTSVYAQVMNKYCV